VSFIGESGDSVRAEFLSETQELIESLSRDLLLLDQAQKQGTVDPEQVNEIFRGVHTLKGLAGMFGYTRLAEIANALENLLDDLRLGRVALTQEALDVLFEGVESFQRLLAEAKHPGEPAQVDLARFDASVRRLSMSSAPASAPATLDDYALEPGLLSVLTEYEEHRLRSSVAQGCALHRLAVTFSLASIDTELEALKARAKPIAELITYLPTVGAGDGDVIALDVLLASRQPVAELVAALATGGAVLTTVARRGAGVAVTETPVESLTAPRVVNPPAVTIPPEPVRTSAHAVLRVEEASRASLMPRAGDSVGLPREASAALDALTLRSVSNTVRVDIAKLDHLMNVVAELALVRSAVGRVSEKLRGQAGMRQLAAELQRVQRGFERHLGHLQEGILDVRMVPLGQVFEKLARIVRQVARDHGKEIRLVVTGAETEVDKLIVEELSDPLMHIIRNAIDHGIEPVEARVRAGKPRAGTLALNAFPKGSHVLIEVEDDGAGMDPERMRETAVRRGVVSAEQAAEFSRGEALGLIFLPGFSTRESVTDLSGRGVGMDVVKTNIARLGGVVDLTSTHGIGTKFTITLPITLAIVGALIVKVAGRTYAVPLSAVQEAVRLDPRAVHRVEGREVLSLRGASLTLCRLARHFAHTEGDAAPRGYVVVAQIGQRRVGFVVDQLLGQQDIVIKPLGASLRAVPGFAGATDLGDQRVALVLDVARLIEEVLATPGEALTLGAAS
jgi:two-component system chemotaxis sensor kinase CheA